MTKKKILQGVMLTVSVLLNIWGICSLLYVNKIFNTSILSYLDKVRLIVRYVIIVITMGGGIMLFSSFATTFEGKLKNTLAIINCTYSTILTIPLFLVFVGCFFSINGVNLPLIGEMVNEIAVELSDIFKSRGMQYTIFTLGTIMGIIFLAVPIIMTYFTVNGKKKKA